MKRRFWLILAAALLLTGLCAAAQASSGSCGDDVDWSLSSDGTLTIMGTGPTWDYDPSGSTSPFKNDTSVVRVVFRGNVTHLGDRLFEGCSQLASIDMPPCLRSIGVSAFHGCTSLAEADFPFDLLEIGEAAFLGCSGLNSVSFKENLVYIGTAAFMDCTGIDRVWLPDTVTFLGNQAFSGCTGLETLRLSDGLTVINQSAFDVCSGLTEVEIPAGVTTIGYFAFYGCTSLTDVYIYNKTAEIGQQAFYRIPASATIHGWSGSTAETAASTYHCGFSPLTVSGTCGSGMTWSFDPGSGELTVSGSGSPGPFYDYTAVPWYRFRSAITSARFNEGVTNLPVWILYDCTAMTSVRIPATVTDISLLAFLESNAVQQYIVAGGNTVYKSVGGVLFSKDGRTLVRYPAGKAGTYSIPSGTLAIGDSAFQCAGLLTCVVIPDSVAAIGENAFNSCMALDTVSLPYGLTGIDAGAFSFCTALETIQIPDSVWRIGAGAFEGCIALQHVDLSYGLTVIGREAFLGCRSLSGINFPESLDTIQDYAFNGCSSLSRVILPASVNTVGEWALATVNLVDAYILNPDTYFDECAFIPNDVSLCIHGWAGSTAETFADGSGILFDPWPTSGQCGNDVWWTVEPESMSLLITGSGPMWDFIDDEPTWAPLNDMITHVDIENGVTRIGYYAFYMMGALRDVSIPSSVTAIGNYAFGFDSSLMGIAIPGEVTTIGSGAFCGCTSLLDSSGYFIFRDVLYCCDTGKVNATVPAGVTTISGSAFMNCHQLQSVTLPGTVTYIGEYAFYNCYELTGIVIPDSVTEIGNYAFSFCTYLEEVTLSEHVDTIGDYVFVHCATLNRVTFMYPLTIIGEGVFAQTCEDLVICGWQGSSANDYADSLDIPFEALENGGRCGDFVFWKLDGNTLIFYGAGDMNDYEQFDRPWFVLHEDIYTAEFREGVTYVGNYACGILDNLSDVIMADSVTRIGPNAFRNCGSLVTMTIGSGVTDIGNFVFSSDRNLEAILVSPGNTAFLEADGVLFNADQSELVYYPCVRAGSEYSVPSGVETIHPTAFAYSQNLTRVILPDSVRTVGTSAFNSAAALTSLVFRGAAPTFGNNVFYGVTLTAYIPADDPTWTAGVRKNYGGTVTWAVFSDPDFFLPAGLTVLEDEAFAGIAARGVVIPEGVTVIHGNPFRDSNVTTVYGFPGSAAETFAAGNGYTFWPIDGDWLAAR